MKVNLYKNLKKLQMKKDNCLLVNKEKKEIVEAANQSGMKKEKKKNKKMKK